MLDGDRTLLEPAGSLACIILCRWPTARLALSIAWHGRSMMRGDNASLLYELSDDEPPPTLLPLLDCHPSALFAYPLRAMDKVLHAELRALGKTPVGPRRRSLG